ncbi:hypothetical protein SAMN06265222_10887 [Neorhodopirellula lusitana]|uniref:Response regulatory domain-containing protein n=1 Tax=Neorhodopirellula lusitana TaxID=445327 RepID=A0ABY1Q8X8_9BACT|nr:response regulator [Neorhodopirellula lusitana]SMP63485.1 hypothetical protein SAMN06265222_10887 [Neorhodopirellula lusitana]
MVHHLNEVREVAFVLVDDSELDGEVFRRALVKHNLERPIHFVTDPTCAIASLHEQLELRPNRSLIVFLDLNMPGVSGHDVLKEIRNDPKLASSLVFVLTTSDHERDVRLAYSQNVAGYFTKANMDKLIEAMKPFAEGVLPPPVNLD